MRWRLQQILQGFDRRIRQGKPLLAISFRADPVFSRNEQGRLRTGADRAGLDHEVRYPTPQDAMMSCLPRNLCLDADAWRLIQIVRGEGYVLTANLERFGPGGR